MMMSRSRGPPLQSRHKSGNLSIAEYDAEPNIQRSQIGTGRRLWNILLTRNDDLSRTNDAIALNRQYPLLTGGIVRTTEVIVSREQNIPEPPPSPPVVSKLSRMGFPAYVAEPAVEAIWER
jgi:hypothetical protein